MANKTAIGLIRRWEGLRLTPYKCPAGYWTVGYGHLITRDKNAPRPPDITMEEAEALLIQDAATALRSVYRLVQVPISGAQAGALASFVFNLGGAALQRSRLRALLNRGDYDGAAEQFDRWVYAGGRKLRGLVLRRAHERAVFESHSLPAY